MGQKHHVIGKNERRGAGREEGLEEGRPVCNRQAARKDFLGPSPFPGRTLLSPVSEPTLAPGLTWEESPTGCVRVLPRPEEMG